MPVQKHKRVCRKSKGKFVVRRSLAAEIGRLENKLIKLAREQSRVSSEYFTLLSASKQLPGMQQFLKQESDKRYAAHLNAMHKRSTALSKAYRRATNSQPSPAMEARFKSGNWTMDDVVNLERSHPILIGIGSGALRQHHQKHRTAKKPKK